MAIAQETYDRISRIWEASEESLRKLKCPVEVEVDLCEKFPDCILGWRKIAGTWRIGLLFEDEWRPVRDCPIADRVLLIDALPQLKAAMEAAIVKFEADALQAVERGEAIVAQWNF